MECLHGDLNQVQENLEYHRNIGGTSTLQCFVHVFMFLCLNAGKSDSEKLLLHIEIKINW